MAHIGIENISEIKLTVIPQERRFDSKCDLAVHPLVAAKYIERNYDAKPKTEEEALSRGERDFNGLVSSCARISNYPIDHGKLVIADVAPTRYLIGQALRDVTKEGKYQPNVSPQMSPDMVGVSLVVPVKINGQYFLMSQIKGKALGSGEVHTGLVAGNVDGKYLSQEDPFVAALQNECSEEVGLDLSSLDRTAALYMVDERETGQVNFAYLARNVDAQQMLHSYDQSVRDKLAHGEALEVMALTAVPLGGAQLEKLETGAFGLKGITTFHPTPNGLMEKIEDRGIRPYTQATLDYLAKPENVRFLLEKAGF